VLVEYGLSVIAQTSAAVPLVLQFVFARLCTCFQQTFNALIVDIYPESPSTAAAYKQYYAMCIIGSTYNYLATSRGSYGIGWLFIFLTVLSGGGRMVTIGQ
jgi:hypothetical protein